MENLIKHSAADLLKKSAMQIVFLRNRKERYATKMQEIGNEYQSKVSNDDKYKNKGLYAEELRGSYSFDNNVIFFCIDMISDGNFFEIKSIQDKEGNITDEYPEWYLNNSLLQCAFYKSMLILGDNKTLFTPKFRIKEGFEYKAMEVEPTNDYTLLFGDKLKFKVDVKKPQAIIDFYKNKIEHLENYDTAKEYDNQFKFKDFDVLKKCFKYTEI